ncbi:alanine racemase [Modestobacter marinus]|uniref:alanine racemase n=1 Tax=Modestobacter marinus TaxID=477641 RepID=UPI001C98C66D|nr:alanine racemase [Modestobacter marinus]
MPPTARRAHSPRTLLGGSGDLDALPLDTPFLLLDVEVLDRNLQRMAGAAAEWGIALRPHAKTHKSLDIGRRQLAAGANGLTVATVAEAEIFADGGVQDVFIAYPVWAAGGRARRLRALADRVQLRVGVDSADGARLLGTALRGTGASVLVEVDAGHHRSGVAPGEAGTVAVAAAEAGLDVVGVFTFPGHGYVPGARRQAAEDEASALTAAAEQLARAGLAAPVRSGGSTPTAALTGAGPVTELRPGVYAFNDAQQVELGSCSWDDVALAAVATVVSARGNRVILDAGSKTLGADQPGWATGGGRLPDHLDARITALSEHHATVELGDATTTIPPGARVRVVPNHVCAAVNLADELVAVEGARLTSWRVHARGANT